MRRTFYVLIACVLGLGCGTWSARAIEISSTTPWTDTGIDVVAGQILEITASGTVSWATQSPGVDANGVGPGWEGTLTHPSTVAPSAIWLSLIGKVGGSADIGTGTLVPEGATGKGAGFVGTTYSQVVGASGRLFLGFNDTIENFGDNSGAFSVTVSVLPGSAVPDSLSSLGLLLLALIAVVCLRWRFNRHAAVRCACRV